MRRLQHGPSRAGLAPTVKFEELMQKMVESDLEQASRTRDHGELLAAADSW